jgi:hypothetical protein
MSVNTMCLLVIKNMGVSNDVIAPDKRAQA